MPYVRKSAALLEMSSSATTKQTGTAFILQPSETDEDSPSSQLFWAYFTNTQSGGATSPTSQAIVECSEDGGTTWATVASSTQLTADGTKTEYIAVTLPVGTQIRCRTQVGGGTAPSHTVKAYLASTGLFNLSAAP